MLYYADDTQVYIAVSDDTAPIRMYFRNQVMNGRELPTAQQEQNRFSLLGPGGKREKLLRHAQSLQTLHIFLTLNLV